MINVNERYLKHIFVLQLCYNAKNIEHITVRKFMDTVNKPDSEPINLSPHRFKFNIKVNNYLFSH